MAKITDQIDGLNLTVGEVIEAFQAISNGLFRVNDFEVLTGDLSLAIKATHVKQSLDVAEGLGWKSPSNNG